MKPFTSRVALRLSSVVLLISVGTLLVGGGAAAVTRLGPWPVVVILLVSAVLLTGATWSASQRWVAGPILKIAE